MSTVDFNTLIYTASKSLKNAEVDVPEASDDLNNVLQYKVLHMVQNKTVFKQELSIKSWFFNVLNKTFTNHPESIATISNSQLDTTIVPNLDGVNEIHSVVTKMEEKLMVPFIMHFQGFKYEEIAENLNLTVEAVQERIQAARMFMVNQISE